MRARLVLCSFIISKKEEEREKRKIIQVEVIKRGWNSMAAREIRSRGICPAANTNTTALGRQRRLVVEKAQTISPQIYFTRQIAVINARPTAIVKENVARLCETTAGLGTHTRDERGGLRVAVSLIPLTIKLSSSIKSTSATSYSSLSPSIMCECVGANPVARALPTTVVNQSVIFTQ